MKEMIDLMELYEKIKMQWEVYNIQFVNEVKRKLQVRRKSYLTRSNMCTKIDHNRSRIKFKRTVPNVKNKITSPVKIKAISRRIRQLFILLSRLLHPDKGGDTDKFRTILYDYDNENMMCMLKHMFQTNIDFDKYSKYTDVKDVKLEIERIKKTIDRLKKSLAWKWGCSRAFNNPQQ